MINASGAWMKNGCLEKNLVFKRLHLIDAFHENSLILMKHQAR